MLCINKHGKLALLLHLCNGVQGKGGLAAGLWPKDLDDTSLGVAAPQCTVQCQAAGGEALTAGFRRRGVLMGVGQGSRGQGGRERQVWLLQVAWLLQRNDGREITQRGMTAGVASNAWLTAVQGGLEEQCQTLTVCLSNTACT